MPQAIVERHTLSRTFEALGGRIGLIPFIPAGYPDLETTAAILPALQQAGATAIEIGFPFSDPIADGPTIQEAYTAALSRKIRVDDVFSVIQSERARLSVPLVGMLSYSIIYRYGLDRFGAGCRNAGIDGLIIPDLPPPEAQRVCPLLRSFGLDTILLVAPTTSLERRQEIARLCTGFIYYLSVSGITGPRAELPDDLLHNLQQLQSLAKCPICVGFGISKPEHLARLNGHADGAIVGSALVERIRHHAAGGPSAMADACAKYITQLLSLVR